MSHMTKLTPILTRHGKIEAYPGLGRERPRLYTAPVAARYPAWNHFGADIVTGKLVAPQIEYHTERLIVIVVYHQCLSLNTNQTQYEKARKLWARRPRGILIEDCRIISCNRHVR